MTFRLTTLLYVFALLSAALAIFGGWGILVAGVVFGSWIARGRAPSWWSLIRFCWVFLLLLLLFSLIAPPLMDVRTPSLRSTSLIHTKLLLLGILNYESVHGHLPPPYVTDDQGTPLYSWRVALLPYIEYDNIYKQLHLDEPWNSPHNRKLLDQVDVSLFTSPRVSRDWKSDGSTNYVAIVDSATAWPEFDTISCRDVADGTSNTVAIIEVGGLGIHWAEPRDITMEEAIDLLTGQPSHVEEVTIEKYFGTEVYQLQTRVVGFLDGHAEGLSPLKFREDARALLTRSGRERLDEYEELDAFPTRHLRTIIHWDRIWGVTALVAIILLPAVPAVRQRVVPSFESKVASDE